MVNRCKNELRMFWRRNRADISELQNMAMEQKDLTLLIDVFSLSPRYKDAVYMHYYEGYSVNEIAGHLGISPSAVKMRLSRAREMLRWEGEDNG
jgi:RNA polymerase sigma-70 factor (ECF subfamily)